MVLQNRSELATAKRVVVKVGSSSISGANASKIAKLVAA
jgi:glutamate 5-kinase